ncbi:translocation and assembly module lipoprotein TamL [Winogradskyella jejuensis]|uniref:Surface antigen variable number repeat-containing protein n=1 Tax=Winogradskyella jejuensis TaxID=1089305 RepID=A0A1M5L943_9FLAO|nr:BamA/TamA family outer membrane protein [Winogradskyella jejuensis]SHG61496.1 Surface antigen variable number repeat-containing protein [Winogradskyella jejuensis]
MVTSKLKSIKAIGALLLLILIVSCNTVKRVKDNQYLLTENKIEVDGKVTKKERVNNIPLQKPNTTVPLLGIPVKLHVYNLARPNIDSILQAKIYDDSSKVKRKTKILSKKQLERELQARRNFNSWLKRIGEAPTILNEDKTEKTKNRLRSYYFKRGWLYNEVDYTIERDSNKRAKVKYSVTKNSPSILDTLKTDIKTPVVDSIYQANKNKSFLKEGQQYDEDNFTKERSRLNTLMRNSGLFFFGQDYVRFEIDTFKSRNTYNTELFIGNRTIRYGDSTRTRPFKIYTIKDVNIYTDASNENRIEGNQIKDSTTYNGYNIYSFEELKFKPKALTDAIFIKKGDIYRDINRTITSRHLNQLQMFRYPGVDFVANEVDSTLTANIFLSPRKKYELGFSFDVSQSNIQTVGFAFSTGLKIRNVFRGAETLDISALGSIGASKDAGNDDDSFFDINEFGGSVGLTIPRIFFPMNTDKIIPKTMSPNTKINIAATSQQNIGLDRQTLSSIFAYNWFPSEKVTNNLELFNVQYVRNLNVNNYFGVYSNSFNRLNDIARNINYIGPNDELRDETLQNQFTPADVFINDVLIGNTSLSAGDDAFVDVNNIKQRQDRLTEDNLIISSSFDYKKDTRTDLSDNNFSTFKYHVELAGNLLSGVSRLASFDKNADGRYEVLNVPFSQYFKTELDYVKYFGLRGKKSVLAFRGYFGMAIPFGNSNNIPFVESFFAGGPNDNRAWTAYNLGPGSSQNTNEFNEANLKLHFSLEQRFNLFGNFDGALFVDAGNIWNAFGNVEDDPESTFTSLKSLRNIAVGSGFGIRYDFTFFVLRGDIGFKTYDPSLQMGNRWFTNYNFTNATYNIGINYPF